MSANDLTIDAAVLANVQATLAIDLQDRLVDATQQGDPAQVKELSNALAAAIDKLAALRANASGCTCTAPECDGSGFCLYCRRRIARPT